MSSKSILYFIFLFFISVINAQVSLQEISLKQQIENSSLVVEGKVISQKSFWDTNHKMIYTKHSIQVYKVFKGKPEKNVEVLTIGGFVGMDGIIASHTLELQEGSLGVFTLQNSNVSLGLNYKGNQKLYKVYSSAQGFYSYDMYNDLAVGVFKKRQGIKTALYSEILGITKKDYVVISSLKSNTNRGVTSKNSLIAVDIVNFSPTTITAGTKSTLTISGSGFGSVKGSVGFRNADNGGSSFINAAESEVLTWSDNQITVHVPTDGGTGNIRVIDAEGGITESSAILTIRSSQINVTSNSGDVFQLQHYDDNSLGGYTLELESRFFNDSDNQGARADFEKAVEKWRCETKINWEISNVPSNETTREASGNLIAFDDVADLEVLPAGNLGTTFSRFSGRSCVGGSIWFLTSFDILFNKDVNWHFGDGSMQRNEFDFESVALHELGHAHQLGHVINPGDLMHFRTISGFSNRILDQNSIDAANDIQQRSTTNEICGDPSLMISYAGSCTLNLDEEFLANTISVFPNPAKDEFFIKNESSEEFNKLIMYDLRGRQVMDYTLNNRFKNEKISAYGLSKGVYILNLESKNGVITKKLVLQ